MRALVLAGKIGPAFGTRVDSGNVIVASSLSVAGGSCYVQEYAAKREHGSLNSRSVVRSMRKRRGEQIERLLGYAASDYMGEWSADYAANLPAYATPAQIEDDTKAWAGDDVWSGNPDTDKHWGRI